MPKYFVMDSEVTREQAVKFWHDSYTYRNAAQKGRGWIFLLADRGCDESATVHLTEAGIRIEHDSDDALRFLLSGARAQYFQARSRRDE